MQILHEIAKSPSTHSTGACVDDLLRIRSMAKLSFWDVGCWLCWMVVSDKSFDIVVLYTSYPTEYLPTVNDAGSLWVCLATGVFFESTLFDCHVGFVSCASGLLAPDRESRAAVIWSV